MSALVTPPAGIRAVTRPHARRVLGLFAAVAVLVSSGGVGAATVPSDVPRSDAAARALVSSPGEGVLRVAIQTAGADGQWAEPVVPGAGSISMVGSCARWRVSSPVDVATGDGTYRVRIRARSVDADRVAVVVQQQFFGRVWANLPGSETVNVAGLDGDTWMPASRSVLAVTEPATPRRRWNDLGAFLTPTGVLAVHVEDHRFGHLLVGPTGVVGTVQSGRVVDPVVVAVDPGHGGAGDSGAVSPGGISEADLNLALAARIVVALAARGIPAALTRTGDYNVSLTMRMRLAEALRASVFVSVHHNAPSPAPASTPGSEVYVQSAGASLARGASARLGGLIHEHVTEALGRFADVEWAAASNAGVMRVVLPEGGDAYSVVALTAMPAVLVEYGYLSNPSEAALFATEEYLVAAAEATASAVEEYLDSTRHGSLPNAAPRVVVPVNAPEPISPPLLE